MTHFENSEGVLPDSTLRDESEAICEAKKIKVESDFVCDGESDEEVKKVKGDKVYLFIEDLKPDFDSHDLMRLFVTLSKFRDDSNGLSLKGISFWVKLSKNSKYKILYKKYKPWSLHTSYKRIFSHVTVDEAIGIMKSNHKADVSFMLKIARKRKEIKNGVKNAVVKKPRKKKPKVKEIKKQIERRSSKTLRCRLVSSKDKSCCKNLVEPEYEMSAISEFEQKKRNSLLYELKAIQSYFKDFPFVQSLEKVENCNPYSCNISQYEKFDDFKNNCSQSKFLLI
jgi:hypothetical protein